MQFQVEDMVQAVEFPAAYFRAPQFYYTDHPSFETNPRQQQTILCGRPMFPIPMELPRFTPMQKFFSNYLRSSILVNNVSVDRPIFRGLIRQATLDNAGNLFLQLLYRENLIPGSVRFLESDCVSSVGPTHTEVEGVALLPAENLIDDDQPYEHFDSIYNPSFSRRLSTARSMSSRFQSSVGSILTNAEENTLLQEKPKHP